jgi:ABC-2 type transport system permease protein
VMEQHYGKDQVRRFLKYELDRYLRSRGGAALEELPLDRVENQDYIYYRKGSVAMYWAKEALGEDVVNRAMRKLLAQSAFKGAPYPNTTDFLKLLRAEAGPRNEQVIVDLFEKITILDLKAGNAVATQRPDGKYEVKFDVQAHKFYADGAGKETEAPMDEDVEVGVFTARPGDKGFGPSDVLLLHKVPVQGPSVPITVVVDRRPTWVGIDPYNKRIDRNSDDNLTQVGLPR